MTTTTRLTAAAAALAVLAATAACRDELDPPPPQTSQTSVTPTTGPPSSTTPGTTGTTPAPAATSLTPTEQAEAKAEAAYRAWVKNYAAAAAAGFDPKKLDSRLATPQLIDYVTNQFDKVRAPGVTGRYTQDIRSMKPTRYVKGQTVEFQMCAIADIRFLKNGKDVTTTPEGAPVPVETKPKLYTVGVQSVDVGKTWKSSTIVYPSSNKSGSPTCSG